MTDTDIKLEWRNGLPYSKQFQDVYFSSDNGMLETEYVFLQGNDLPNRWQNHAIKTFIITETGFGTGLNFLCAVKLWLSVAPVQATLHFITVEKYPLSLQDITSALQLWPSLTGFSAPLLTQYTALIATGTISLYDDRIRLTLLIGDATEQLSLMNNKSDAWFLDGFSPAKNPDMWQPLLFNQMAQHSLPGATFATFTSAGIVRRGLAEAGFKVNKRAGFGKKREMIYGRLANTNHDS